MHNEDSNDRRTFLRAMVAGSAAVGALGFIRPALAQADTAEWITVTATLTLNPDNADAALAGLKTLVTAVEENEPGVLAYICNRGVEDRNEILFFEIYANEDAGRLHGQTGHMQTFQAEAGAGNFFAGQMKVSSYERVAGYHR